MPSSKFRPAVAVLLVLAAVSAAAPTLHAQSGEVLRGREVAESGHARLGDAIAALRPSWLQLAGDSVAADAVSRVAVFVNGRHRGDARVLYTIPADEVVSARLRTSEYVRRTDPRFPRDEFDVAIYVATRAQPVAKPRGRLTLSLEPGLSIRGLPGVMHDQMQSAGYTTSFEISDRANPGETRPPSLGGTVNYRVAGPWGAALTGHAAAEGWVGGYSGAMATAVSAFFRSAEGALLATREAGMLRVGAGAAYRQVDWDWAGGFCACGDPEEMRTSALGIAADARVELLARAPVFPVIRLFARYYPSETVRYRGLDLDAGGLVTTMSVAVGTRF